MPAVETWNALEGPWRTAFDQAWASFVDGNLGIGAVLVDPATGEEVAAGHNRVHEASALPRTLSGNFMAHAEMNAFAAMDRFKASGLHLYTTLRPCLMCAATSIFLNVQHVRFAADDEFFEGMDGLWHHHAYSRHRQPTVVGPIGGRLASLARVLPLTVQTSVDPTNRALAVAHEKIPAVAALAREFAADDTLTRLAADADGVVDVLHQVWDRLPD
ncbi:MAG: nucleoside deaminase [Actinomycetota bacterium]